MPVSTTAAQLQKWADAGVVDRARVEEAVRSIQIEVMRMKQLLTAFSDFAKLPQANFTRVVLETFVTDIKDLFAEQIANGHLHLHVEGDHAAMICDADQVRQVILNLVTNSYEANASVVEIKIYGAVDRLNFEISDDGEGIKIGPGIDPFTPLYTTKSRGSGLGLAICRRIIIDHGGDITYQNNPTGGTVFAFYLPQGVS